MQPSGQRVGSGMDVPHSNSQAAAEDAQHGGASGSVDFDGQLILSPTQIAANRFEQTKMQPVVVIQNKISVFFIFFSPHCFLKQKIAKRLAIGELEKSCNV